MQSNLLMHEIASDVLQLAYSISNLEVVEGSLTWL